MGRLSTFLESFNNDVKIRIYDQNNILLFEGLIGDVPHRIEDQANIILGSANIMENIVTVIIKAKN